MNARDDSASSRGLRSLLSMPAEAVPIEMLNALVRDGLDQLPMPGSGDTLQRWRALSEVAAVDLSLAKLYEGHTDALAILKELGGDQPPPGSTWGVWAAEAPGSRVVIERQAGGQVRLNGTKAWCSGAAQLSHALLTAWSMDGGGPWLVAVALRQPGVQVDPSPWQAVGMADSSSLSVQFDGVEARAVGAAGSYLKRPGFWQGGAGIAACWFGAASAIGGFLRRAVSPIPSEASSSATPSAAQSAAHAFRLAALGHVDAALAASAAVLRESAGWIDAHPSDDASEITLRARLTCEMSATEVLQQVGRALGATPYCRDRRFARLAADLPVFLRQSHAERDFAALGERVAPASPTHWTL